MSITVLCFASIREKIGDSQIIILPPVPITVSGLLDYIKFHYPQVTEHLAIARVAVNQEFVTPSFLLKEGDEVAIIPPVSGG